MRFAFKILLFGVLLVFGLNLCVLFVAKVPTCADMFVWPYFVNDFYSGHFDFAKWTLPPAGYLFPDLPVYWILHFLCKGDVMFALFLQTILYGFLFVWGLATMMEDFLRWKKGEAWLVSSFIGLIITQLILLPGGINVGLLLTASHGQTTLWLFLCAHLLYKYWNKPTAKGFFILCLVTALGSFGDRIFAIWYSAAAALCALFSKNWKLLAGIVLSTILGMMAAYLISPDSSLLYTPDGTWRMIAEEQPESGLSLFISDLYKYLINQPLMIFSLVSTFGLGGYYLWRARKDWPWWAPGAVCLALASFGLSMALGIYAGDDSWRHFPFIILFGLLLVFAVLRSQVIKGKGIPMVAAVMGLLLSACFITDIVLLVGLPIDQVRQPHFVQMAMAIKKEFKLKDGLASYWYCKQVNLLMHGRAFLAPMWPDGRINPVLDTLADYEGHDFNYVLCDHNDPAHHTLEKLINRLGQPKTIYYAPGLYMVLIYPDGVLNQKIAQDPLRLAILKQRGMVK